MLRGRYRSPVMAATQEKLDFKAELESRLIDAQRRDLDVTGGFNVRGGDGRLYRITLRLTSYVYGPPMYQPGRGHTPAGWTTVAYGYFAAYGYDSGHLSSFEDERYSQALAKLVMLQCDPADLLWKACRSNGNGAEASLINDYNGAI